MNSRYGMLLLVVSSVGSIVCRSFPRPKDCHAGSIAKYSSSSIIDHIRCVPVTGGRKPFTQSCDCVPFYRCRHQDAMTIRSCGETEVCCARGAPAEEECGWGEGGAEGGAGGEARPGEFPWMLAILNVSAGLNWTREGYVGGAAVIHARVALTVAHKVQGKTADMLKCRAGQWSRSQPGSQVQDRSVATIHVHPDYERKYTANDVALLSLSEPLDVSPAAAVRPLCVARGPPPRPDLCYAMGWRQKQVNHSENADQLKKVQVSLVPHALCQNALQAFEYKRQAERGVTSPSLRLELHSTLTCAGGVRGEDVCAGDGGSPLVCQIHQVNATWARYAGWGLAAWGVGCGGAGAPGVYADLARLHDWIIRQLKTII